MSAPDLPGSPSQQVQDTRVKGNLTQTINVSVADGAVLGFGIWSWEDWVQRAQRGARGPAAEATNGRLDSGAIHRVGEQKIVAAVCAWAESSSVDSLTVGIIGKHGTGATWSLLNVGEAIAAQGFQDLIFVVDDLDRFSKTDLTKAIPKCDRCILLIDDADVQQAMRPLRHAIGTHKVCAIYTTADRRYAGLMSALNPRKSALDLELPDLPSPRELQSLRHLLDRPHLSNADSHGVARANLRSAVRILRSLEPTETMAQRLVDLRSDDTAAVPGSVAFLLFSTARDLLLPQALALRAVGGDISAEVMTWVQVRPYLQANGQIHNLLWIEDRMAARLAENMWQSSGELDKASRRDAIEKIATVLVSAASADSAQERTFVRQLFKTLPPSMQVELTRRHALRLREFANREERTELVFGWLPILKAGGIGIVDLVNARLRTQDHAAPYDGVDLILAINAMGESSAVTNLEAYLAGAQVWPASAWVQFIAMLEHVSSRHTAVLLQTALPLLRGRSDLPQILQTGNSVQLLVPLVERFAPPKDRSWVRECLVPLVATQPYTAPMMLSLTGRCLAQPRSERGLRILRVVTSGSYGTDFAKLFTEEIQALADEEAGAALAHETVDAVAVALRLTTMKPSVVNNIWRSLLIFARTWDPDRAAIFTREAADYVEKVRGHTPYAHILALHNSTLIGMSRFGLLEQRDVEAALLPFLDGRRHISVAQAALNSLSAFANSDLWVADLAMAAIRALICDEPVAAKAAVGAFLADASRGCPEQNEYVTPPAFLMLDHSWTSPLMQQLVQAMRWLDADELKMFNRVSERWHGFSDVHQGLAREALRLGLQGSERSLFEGMATKSPTWACLCVAAEAADGHLAIARQGMKDVLASYQERRQGAHPYAVHQASASMARATLGDESVLYGLIARLMRLGPL